MKSDSSVIIGDYHGVLESGEELLTEVISLAESLKSFKNSNTMDAAERLYALIGINDRLRDKSLDLSIRLKK